MSNKNRYLLIESDDGDNGVKIEKIIAPEELQEIKIGISDETILELDAYQVNNDYILVVDKDGDRDDGVYVSPVIADNDKEPDEIKSNLLSIVEKTFGDSIDLTPADDSGSGDINDFEDNEGNTDENEDNEDDPVLGESLENDHLNEDDEQSQYEDASKELTEAEGDDESDDNADDENGGEKDEALSDDNLDDESVNPSEDVTIEVLENEDGSLFIKGDVPSILDKLVGEENATEILGDLGEPKLDTDASMKIESLIRKANRSSKIKNML